MEKGGKPRSIGCSFEEALNKEAATILMHSINLARGRGHTEVNLIHLVKTLISPSSGPLRAACLQSQSHPWQIGNLEFCIKAALDRLPICTTSNNQLYQEPTIPNSLIEALRRARRSIQKQPQTLLPVKIDLKQLILSVLDDPRVSEIMSQAGFSSTLVKEKVEQAVTSNQEGGGGGGANLIVLSGSRSIHPCSTSNQEGVGRLPSWLQHTEKRFKDYNEENLKALFNALEAKVPWQRNSIWDIVQTVLSCRSGMVQRQDNNQSKEETWLLFLGADSNAKEKIAKELAMLVFGSQNKYNPIALSSFSSTEDSSNKRMRDEQSSTCIDKLAEAISNDPHRVFFVEDIEQVDYFSQVEIKRAIERGKLRRSNREELVSLGDSIIILSSGCERFSSRSLNLNMSISGDCGDQDQLGLLAAVDKWSLFAGN